MALDVQHISLDISKQPTPQQVRLGQGDANATQLVVSVFDDGVAYDLSSYSVRLLMRLPNDGGYYDVDGTRSGNVATFDIDETYAASVHGFDGYGYIDVMDGETVICSTSRFQLVVLQCASDGVELSAQYSDAVNSAIDRATAAAEAAEGVVLQDVPTMSATVKGGATLGDGLSVVDGALSLSGESYTSAEKSKLAGIEANANNYALPTMGASTKGGAKLGSGLSVANDTLSLNLPTMSASTKGGAKLGAGLSVSNDVLSVNLAVETFTLSYSVAANTGSGAVDINISKTGYTPLGIVGAASGSQSVALVQFSLFNATTARCYFRNVSSSDYSPTCNIRVLYMAQ